MSATSSSSATADDNTLLISQELLEQNEDIIAAVVENMQLGRLDDCIQHYSTLHKNLISLALALDNFPAGDHTRLPYHDITHLPDEIMRKDILDELRPLGQTKLPQAPLTPSCVDCNNKHFTTQKCRVQLNHIEPSHTYSSTELQEFLKVSQLLEYRSKTVDEPVKTKRVYRVWSPSERHTVLLGISLHGVKGASLLKILEMLPNRNEGQLRSYISKNINENELNNALKGVLPVPPEKYVYPLGYAPDRPLRHSTTDTTDGSLEGIVCSGGQGPTSTIATTATSGVSGGGQYQAQAWQQASLAGQGASRLEPGRGTGDWTALLGIVDGQGGVHVPMPVYSAGVASVGPVLPNHTHPHVHSLAHSHVMPAGAGAVAGPLLPSISSSLLPPPPLPHYHTHNPQQQLVPPRMEENANIPKKRRRNNKEGAANSNSASETTVSSGKLGKKRGKYKKRNKDKGENLVSTATTSASGNSSQIDNGIEGTDDQRDVILGTSGERRETNKKKKSKQNTSQDSVALSGGVSGPSSSLINDDNSMYMPMFGSPQQSHSAHHGRLSLPEDGKAQEIIFDGFSQFSFDWENSQPGGGFGRSPDRDSGGGMARLQQGNTPLSGRRLMPQSAITSSSSTTTSTRNDGGLAVGGSSSGGEVVESNESQQLQLQEGGTTFEPDGEGFSHFLNPGEEFSLNIV